ncbi:hypothetical protein [Actinomadura violacea]|uniref:Lipoprotein n=1 Tax=Actinomadura violacea TaxID=2819934 RepID=A0ABS3SAF0_9ACTN|nr:hypothetical protein [Actinomadura violacea]MBO2465994.1 hypothetical protein [Actinomadura violacea]
MKYAYLLVLVLSLAACSTGGEKQLASDCAKINALINKPITVDFDEATFAAQVRALQPAVDDKRLDEQLGIVADHWDLVARRKGVTLTAEDLQKSMDEGDRAIKANDEITRICKKVGPWNVNRRPTSSSSSG